MVSYEELIQEVKKYPSICVNEIPMDVLKREVYLREVLE